MDELPALRAILEKAIQKADEAKAHRITDVYLAVGEISAYRADPLQFHWGELRGGTPAEGAVLHLRLVRAEAQCMSCFTKYHPEAGAVACPNCGGVGAKILAGEEFFLEALKLE
ncbi:MAG TPA: hydrogenase/urease maturation nickel metallochaperone HypA [Anaerolineales bacterium]|nr:hydrogenase/urease maturation nickel metallochaperone HypA [Anaerolineales bacterium]